MERVTTIVAIFFIAAAYFTGSMVGGNKVKSKWKDDIIAKQEAALELQVKIDKLEADHIKMEDFYLSEFEDLKRSYESNISDISDNYANSLLEHEERADYYRQEYKQCNSDTAAIRAIRFDKAIVEGVILVKELRELVKFREYQLKLSTDIIRNDRALINKAP